MKNLPLETRIENEMLSITIGTDMLCHAVEIGRACGLGGIKITDRAVFTQEILNELDRESEDGSTPVHRMLDKAVSRAIENGAQGADYSDT